LVINISQWYHIVVTKNQNTISFYINGLLDSTASNTNIPSYTKDFNIGKKANHWDDHWGGKIDDIRIYNRAISETEIQQLYQGQGMCSNSIVTFTAGTPAKAADVNANFDAHNCQIQALKAIVCQDHPTASICQ